MTRLPSPLPWHTGVLVAAMLVALSALAWLAWNSLAPRQITAGPHLALCPGSGQCRHVHDIAGALPPDAVPRFEEYLHHIQRESDIDIRLVFVRATGERPLEELALALVEELRIGGRTREDRGLLILYDVAAQRMKIEIGYGLEGIFPDAFVSYLVQRHARMFFAAGDTTRGLRLMLRLLQHRVREAVLGEAFDTRRLAALPAAAHLSGGAGVTASVPAGNDAGEIAPRRLEPGGRERFVSQNSPREAYAAYLDWLSQPEFDPDVTLFTDDSRRYLASFALSPAYGDFILLGELGKSHQVVERGDLALLYFTGTPFTSPHFFVRDGSRWRMDIAAEVGNTQEYVGGRFTWGYRGRDDPYTRAFSDLLVNLRGVRRFRDGDNRELEIRGGGDS